MTFDTITLTTNLENNELCLPRLMKDLLNRERVYTNDKTYNNPSQL